MNPLVLHILFDKLKVSRHRDREKRFSVHIVFTLRHKFRTFLKPHL